MKQIENICSDVNQ